MSGIAALVDRLVAEVSGPTDRAEVDDVLRAEGHRRVVQDDRTPLHLPAPAATPIDRCRLVGLADAEPGTVGRWSEVSAVALSWGRVLYRTARAVGGPIVEIGTGSGVSAAYLALGLARRGSGGDVVTIEAADVLAQRGPINLAASGIDGVTVIQGDQLAEAPAQLARRPALLHIDSDHAHASTRALLQLVARHVEDVTVVGLDDIRWSDGMERLWDEATAGGFATSGAIDLGLWGLLVLTPTGSAPVVRRTVDAPHGIAGHPGR
ncbi:MAG TPA: class I SAM-dependent methyltransferase [Iamia sp.]|nr:class I SAM-dependent methyltransferase [Iamia sp.]